MFWSGARIKENMAAIFEPYNEASIDCNAYTLHVGSEVHISAVGETASVAKKLGEGEQFVIPPGQFAFLLTKEVMTIPYTVMAFINVKSSIKLSGLVNVSGFHVDPGYKGRLVISVFNAGPKPVVLAEGDACFLIWFAELTDDASIVYSKKFAVGFNSITSKLVQQIPSNNLSLSTLAKEIDAMKSKIDMVYAIALGLGIPFFFALLVAIIQVVFGEWLKVGVIQNIVNSNITSYGLLILLLLTVGSIFFFVKLGMRIAQRRMIDRTPKLRSWQKLKNAD